MELLQIIHRFQNQNRKNQIIFLFFLVLSILLFLLILIAGFFFNRLILLSLLPVAVLIFWKSEFFNDFITTATKIESRFPEVKNKLVPSVELFQKFKKTASTNTYEGYSDELVDAAIAQAAEKAKGLPLLKLINYQKTRWSILCFIALLLIFGSLRIFNEDNFDLAWNLAFNPKNVPIQLLILPGNIFVNKDSIITIGYSVESRFSNFRTILYAKNRKYKNRTPSFSTTVTADKEFDYFVVVRSILGMPIIRTPKYHIGLNKPIEITDLVFTYIYPSYTKLNTLQNRSSNIKGVTGTKVEFQGSASLPLTSAIRIGQNNSTDTLLIKDNKFKGGFTINRLDSFEIVLNAENHRQGKSIQYYIIPSSDEMPFVKMFLPGRDINVPVNMQTLIGMYGLDDFGVTRFDLFYAKPMTGETVSMRLKTVANKPEDTLFFLWDLTKLNLLPGEEINYYGVVYDNDAVQGHKAARSETYTIRFPTLAEIYDQTTETNQATMNRLEPIAETQNQLSKELDKISEHIKEYREMNWEEKSKINELMAKQEELMSDIASLQQEINNTMSDLYSGLMLDKETLEQLQQISNILNEILPEEMKQNLEKLRQALQEKNPNIAKSLENFKLSSEDMKEALKRALELLKNIKKEEQLTNLARKAEEIFKQQTQLNSRINDEKLDKLVPPQEQIGNEIEELQDEIRETAAEFDDSLLQAELAKITQELNEMQLGNQVGDVSKNLGQNNRSESKKSAAELLKDLQSLKDKLKTLADMFKQNQNELLTEKMLGIANDLNDISKEQEKIKPKETRKNLSEFVVRQKRLSEASTVVAETLARWSEQSLYVSPKWTQEIAKSVTSMERAAQLLEEAVHSISDVRLAQNQQEDAMYSLDIVTLQILRLAFMKQKSDGMKGGLESLLQALSQMTADQMALGQGMSGIPIPVPGGLTPGQMSQLGRLMSMQSQLRSQLEQVLQEINSGKYGEMPGMTGSMQGALEEMKQIEKDLSELNITRQTIERQERAIDRLLDAQRSIRQKEYSEKREREIGKDYPDRPRVVLDKNLGESKKMLREELLRALREGYPKEYEDMIKNYFQSIIEE